MIDLQKNRNRFHQITFKDAVIYDEWTWTLDTSTPSKCKSYYGTGWEDSTYKMCMETKLPKSNTVTFEAISKTQPQEINWNKPKIGEIVPADDLMGAYISPCGGDSGSGQMFLAYDDFGTHKSKEYKFVLAAVYKGSPKDKPCGSYRYNARKNMHDGHLPFCHRISTPNIYDWIRETIKK